MSLATQFLDITGAPEMMFPERDTAAQPLDVDHFLGMRTSTGHIVRDMVFREGHFLVYKIPMARAQGAIALPDQYTAKATRNIVSIKGFVIAASLPWCRKTAKQYWEWDPEQEMELPKYRTVRAESEFPSDIKAGMCILYNSYNIAKVEVGEVYDELCVIRECDIFASWAVEHNDEIQLGEHTMDQKAYEHFPSMEGSHAI